MRKKQGKSENGIYEKFPLHPFLLITTNMHLVHIILVNLLALLNSRIILEINYISVCFLTIELSNILFTY